MAAHDGVRTAEMRSLCLRVFLYLVGLFTVDAVCMCGCRCHQCGLAWRAFLSGLRGYVPT
jgi:hypothetical protein